MDNFRKRNRGSQKRALDGMVGSGGSRSGPVNRPLERSSVPTNSTLGSGTRRVDDFARPEGYHVAQQGVVRAAPSTEQQPKKDQSSLLNMTLPGNTFEDPKEKGKAKRSKSKDRDGHSRWRTIRKWTLRSALVLAALVLIIGGFLVFKGILKINKVFKGGGAAAALQENVSPGQLDGEGDGRVNILLAGKGGPGHEGPDLTDTLIMASIDPVNKTTTLLSIPRDLWVSQAGGGSTKINAIYANAKYKYQNSHPKDKDGAEKAGAAAIKQMVSQTLGVPIHYYTMVDFDGFKQAVDTVGGVDINVPEELAVSENLWDEASGKHYQLTVHAGQQHFDSMKALYFTRSRHTSARGDFDRAERQRLLIQALSAKVLSAGTYTNPVKVSQLMSAFGDHVSSDLTVNNALRLAELGKGMNMSKIKSIGLADPPNNYVRTDNVDGISIVRPTAGFGDYSEIQSYIRNALKDPYLAKENATVAVLNGTGTAGRATTMANQLKSYGYNVTTIADAPTQDYANTQLVDLSNGKKPFTKNYLEKRLGVKATTKIPDPAIQAQGIDFVIILGQND